MSSASSALNNLGPTVGKFRTIAVMTLPETISGSSHPIVLAMGLSATRTGYLRTSLVSCSSLDSGQTWSHPRVFDDCGVWPRTLTLENGVTLAAYGRPGLYVRATADPTGLEWEEREVVVEPAEGRSDTCSYSALLALNDRTALLAYSDFNYPNEQGRKCKTILVRTLTVA